MAARAARVPVSLVGGAASAVLAALAAIAFSGWLAILSSAVLGGLMAAIAIEDLRRMRLPDALLLAGAAAGLAASGLAGPSEGMAPLAAIGWAALALVGCAGIFYALREAFHRLRGVDGLGLGDVKLAGVGGAWLGGQGFASAVMVAALIALIFVAVRIIFRGPWPAARRIPFALFLAPAIWGVWYALQWEALQVP